MILSAALDSSLHYGEPGWILDLCFKGFTSAIRRVSDWRHFFLFDFFLVFLMALPARIFPLASFEIWLNMFFFGSAIH